MLEHYNRLWFGVSEKILLVRKIPILKNELRRIGEIVRRRGASCKKSDEFKRKKKSDVLVKGLSKLNEPLKTSNLSKELDMTCMRWRK